MKRKRSDEWPAASPGLSTGRPASPRAPGGAQSKPTAQAEQIDLAWFPSGDGASSDGSDVAPRFSAESKGKGREGASHAPPLPMPAKRRSRLRETLSTTSIKQSLGAAVAAPAALARSTGARLAVYSRRPEARAAAQDALRVLTALATVSAGAFALHATGITPALLEVLAGDSGIEILASSVPLVGAGLSLLLQVGGIYGACAVGIIMSTWSRCMYASPIASGQASMEPWWMMQAAFAFSLSPIFAVGAATNPWILLAAGLGVGILSHHAALSLENRANDTAGSMPTLFGIALGLSPMAASMARSLTPFQALRVAAAFPAFLHLATRLWIQANKLWADFPKVAPNEAGGVLKTLKTDDVYFTEPAEQKALAHAKSVLVPPPLSANSDSRLRDLMEALKDEIKTGLEKPYRLLIKGRPHDGRRTAVKALAKRLNINAVELNLRAGTPAEQALRLESALEQAASQAGSRGHAILLYIPNIENILPRSSKDDKSNPLRAKLLNDSFFEEHPNVVLVCSTGMEEGLLDEALESRLGRPFVMQRWSEEMWRQTLSREVYRGLESSRFGSHIRMWWHDHLVLDQFGSVLDEVAAKAAKDGWTAQQGAEVAMSAARHLRENLVAFHHEHPQFEAEQYPFWQTLNNCLKKAGDASIAPAPAPAQLPGGYVVESASQSEAED